MRKILTVFILLIFPAAAGAHDWRSLADDLIYEYRGKIIAIEQLNDTTCWAVLDPSLLNSECVETAVNIGYYIRNATGGINGETPSVHVFKSGRHIAVARPSGNGFSGELDIRNWNPDVFEGKYRP